MEGLHSKTMSHLECRTDGAHNITSDTSLELVYPPDDGRYTGGGSVYFETVIIISASFCTDADTLLTLYAAREGSRRPHEGGHKGSKIRCVRGINRVGAYQIACFFPASPHFLPSFPPFSVITHASTQRSIYKGRFWVGLPLSLSRLPTHVS